MELEQAQRWGTDGNFSQLLKSDIRLLQLDLNHKKGRVINTIYTYSVNSENPFVQVVVEVLHLNSCESGITLWQLT